MRETVSKHVGNRFETAPSSRVVTNKSSMYHVALLHPPEETSICLIIDRAATVIAQLAGFVICKRAEHHLSADALPPWPCPCCQDIKMDLLQRDRVGKIINELGNGPGERLPTLGHYHSTDLVVRFTSAFVIAT